MKDRMPVLFIGHGSPMNIILDNSFTRSLAAWGKRLPKPRVIMVVSAHWLTSGTFVACTKKPETIHDFYGFPPDLYAVNYPSPGSPRDAESVIDAVKKVKVKCNLEWGLDHASWSVLKHMYPVADIPVFELSLDYSFNDWKTKPMQHHYDLASELSELRGQGILIVGSGNIVHNLSMIDWNIDAQIFPWAAEFDETVRRNILDRNHGDLIRYRNMGHTAQLAVPTPDHYLPMLYVLALQEKDEPVTFAYEGFQHGSISMRCFQIG